MDYSSDVRQRFLEPAMAGVIAPDTGAVVDGAAQDRSLNLWVRFQVRADGATIERVRFQAYGCPHSIAAADRLASELEGQQVDKLKNMDMEALARQIDLPREKFGKLLRIEDALLACHAGLTGTERD